MSNHLEKILYVDDDSSTTKIAEMALGKLGKFNIQTTLSGMEALQILQQNDFDLILLDVMMPEMDGRETFNEIRKMKPDQAIIFITGKDTQEEINELIGMGALTVIKKPFNPIKLAQELKSIWNNQ